MRNGIRPLGPQNRAEIEDAVRLHSDLLPQSPIVRLGLTFMRRFYYRRLVEDGLICADLYYSEGRPAGFIVYTKYPADFMTQGLRRHWVRLAGVMVRSLIRRPLLLAELLRVFSLMLHRKGQAGAVPQGEILSFGVIPEYRGSAFVRRTHQHISLELFERAKEYFRRQNIPSFRMLLEADNREALLFYLAQDCRVQRQASGASGKTIELIYTGGSEPAGASPAGSVSSEPRSPAVKAAY